MCPYYWRIFDPTQTKLAPSPAPHANRGHLPKITKVLDFQGTSYASDVYSFGIVVWEVFSRKLPWEDEACRRDIFIRVVFKEDRPEIPADCSADMTRVMNACWERVSHDRPSFREIMKWQQWE